MRAFRYRDLFLQHELSCDYFLRRKRVRETDALEDLPSGQDQFKWIQALALRVGDLERNVARLTVSDGTRKRSGIQAWLRNPLCPRPSVTLSSWLSEVWIDIAQLDGDKDLVEIMQMMFLDALGSGSGSGSLPLCAFAGCKTVYAWDKVETGEGEGEEGGGKTWIVVTGKRWDGYFARLQHRFRKALQCNDENCCNEAQREGWLLRMRKVNDGGGGRRPADLLAWLRKQLESKSPNI
jgi:hypothetical protein